MRLPTPNHLPAGIYSEGNSFSAAVTTPRSAFTLEPTVMAETQETMSTDDVKGLIGHLLEKIPEDQRVPFLRSQLGHYGIREPSSEPYDFATRRQRDGRHKQVISNNEKTQREIVIFEPIIFACGFANCSLLWEAPPTGNDGKTFRDYIERVIKHYDDDKCAEWSYETRMQNLLRQSRMEGLLQNVDVTGLKWDWKCSTTLRRELMTGNIANNDPYWRCKIAHVYECKGSAEDDSEGKRTNAA
ncbi:hypothetical protein IF1G_11335 [Cordyceps javanica]|uniref:Uncharacterized protein n=1 Tax=Cordyceps javanica TaxID=43265 RepID=A0A545UKL3_9HYPO|nr:hypothetical protein IF1G_11335 [Cordyceps javanica]